MTLTGNTSREHRVSGGDSRESGCSTIGNRGSEHHVSTGAPPWHHHAQRHRTRRHCHPTPADRNQSTRIAAHRAGRIQWQTWLATRRIPPAEPPMNITAAVITLQVLPFDVKSEADYLAAVMATGPPLAWLAAIRSRDGIVKLFGNACGAVDVSGPGGER